jgi:ubiquinone/menaquinone biosynthesis C-methylase UbiE
MIFKESDFPQKKYVILEVAGGSGIGSIALAKSLMERNCEISKLVITDT